MAGHRFLLSPTVVERILMVQKISVTSGTLFSVGDGRNSQVVDMWVSPKRVTPRRRRRLAMADLGAP
jgi:hypothetical protein